jgi:hypothetical protein
LSVLLVSRARRFGSVAREESIDAARAVVKRNFSGSERARFHILLPAEPVQSMLGTNVGDGRRR